MCSCLCCSIHTICKHPTYAFKEQRKNPIVTKTPPSLPSTPTGRTNGDPKISLILYKFEFSGDFCPSGEAGYWERCRTRGVCGEDGLDQEVMLEGIYNSKSHGQRCEVLMQSQQRKNVGKGHQKRQEAKRRFIFKNKM